MLCFVSSSVIPCSCFFSIVHIKQAFYFEFIAFNIANLQIQLLDSQLFYYYSLHSCLFCSVMMMCFSQVYIKLIFEFAIFFYFASLFNDAEVDDLIFEN